MASDEQHSTESQQQSPRQTGPLRFVEESANGMEETPVYETPTAEPAPNAPSPFSTVGSRVSDGISAMRAVSRAKREHTAARTRLRALTDELAEDEEALNHRLDVERHYATIISQQTAELNDAHETRRQVVARAEQLERRRDELTQNLERMKESHEQERRPYRNLMESSKGRADDAGQALSSARRSVKAAEAQLNDATANRESRIAAANRSVDGAQQRITKLTADLQQIQSDPSADPTAVASLQQTLSDEQANFASAKAKVLSVTEETQALVADAQNHLFNVRQSVAQAESNVEAAKAEARAKREEHDRMAEEHRAQEAALNKQIVDCEVELREVQKEVERAKERADDAQLIIDDANHIHATPEQTRELQQRVEQARAVIDEQQRQVDVLADQEQSVRDTTRSKRLVLIGIAVGVVLLIVLLIMLLSGSCAPQK